MSATRQQSFYVFRVSLFFLSVACAFVDTECFRLTLEYAEICYDYCLLSTVIYFTCIHTLVIVMYNDESENNKTLFFISENEMVDVY